MWNLSPNIMKLLGTIFLLNALLGVAEGNTPKQLSLKSANSMIEIDGVLDAACSTADSVSDFFQMQPFFGNPPPCRRLQKCNARPFISVSPVNDLTIRAYLDNVYVRSSDKLESLIFGFLVSHNFLPKSWIYFAINETHDRSAESDRSGNLLPQRLHLTNRAGVLKVKYLYYL